MASLRRATYAVAALRPRPQPLTAVRWASNAPAGGPRRGGRRGGRGRFLGLLSVAFVTGAALYTYSTIPSDKRGEKKGASQGPTVVIPKAEIEFEDSPATITAAAGGNGQNDPEILREELSPQHRQVQSSLEHPGVYAWGSNAGRVVAPDAPDLAVVKEPRRIPFFDGQVLRDLRLDRDVGVAVTEQGDVLQWGAGFWGPKQPPAASATPSTTLKGKDIVKVAMSSDRVIALSAGGAVYSLPISQSDLQQERAAMAASSSEPSVSTSPASSSWWRGALWSSTAAPSTPAAGGVRTLTPPGLAWGERVVDVAAGREHCLLLTSKGRVFSAAASFEAFPARGQLGVPGLAFATRPAGQPLDQPHEVPGLRGIAARQVAAGDHHSLVLSRDGKLYAFGDNAAGQLGIPASPAFPSTDAPVQVPVDKLYDSGGGDDNSYNAIVRLTGKPKEVRPPRVTSIAAGGATSFFTVDAEEPLGSASGGRTRSVADTWSCGAGLAGTLGTGKWVHVSTSGPGKIRALSGLREYSDAAQAVVPIRLAALAAGATHASAVLGNAAHVAVPGGGSASATDTNWGRDVLWWGGNEHYQLGTGRRSNQSEPVRVAPLDRDGNGVPLLTTDKPEEALDRTRERMALTPRTGVRLDGGKGRKVSMEQRVVCGRFVSAVYSGV